MEAVADAQACLSTPTHTHTSTAWLWFTLARLPHAFLFWCKFRQVWNLVEEGSFL